MTTWTVDQLLEATQGTLVTRNRLTSVKGITLDSRRLQPHEAFLAIRGVRFDALTFIPEAIQRGASCLIVSQPPEPSPPVPTIVVADTVKALGAIAASHRRRFHIPVVAVTGSCGKTTTKELITKLLSQDRRVLKTEGTENNHIGLPLTLLRLSSDHDVVIVELGSNHPGEIAYLAEITRPTVAVLTNVGPTHLEFFGSLEAVRREKLSLLDALEPSGTAVVPGDQLEVLLEAKSRLRPGMSLITFGTSGQCGVQALEVRRAGDAWSIRLRDVLGECSLPLCGSHNVENALAALACAKAIGVRLDAVQHRLADVSPLPMRSQLMRCNGFTLLNDCYNANPLSFARALEVLRDLEVTRRVVIAGDMLELGPSAPAAHQAIGRLAVQCGVDLLVAVGERADDVAKGASGSDQTHIVTYRTVHELLPQLHSLIEHGDGILIKGSRGLRLEQVTTHLLDHAQGGHECGGDGHA